MPTVVVLDVSLSMCRTFQEPDSEGYSVRGLAVGGLTAFADTVAHNCKLEFTTLMVSNNSNTYKSILAKIFTQVYSSLWERLVPFTRDYDQIKAALLELDAYYDKTNLVNVLNGINEIVTEEWGSQVPINLIIVTDGYAGINSLINSEKLPAFAFPCRLNVMIIGSQNNPGVQTGVSIYEKMIEMAKASYADHQNKPESHIRYPENNELSMKAVKQMFVKLAESNYQYFKGMLHCGSLSSPATIYPPIESFNQVSHEVIIFFLLLKISCSPPILEISPLIHQQILKSMDSWSSLI